MKTILKWITYLVIFGAILFIMISAESDLVQLIKWEVITVIALAVIVCILLIWRRSMRLDETTVCIQFLDD